MLLFVLCLSSGCSSYVAGPKRETKYTTYQRYFVKSNFDDNHGMDARIVEALQERGLTAEKGPMTMMPSTTQGLVSYEEHWAWDFKNHLTGFRIVISDAKSGHEEISGVYTGPTSLWASPDDIVERLLNKVLGRPKKAK